MDIVLKLDLGLKEQIAFLLFLVKEGVVSSLEDALNGDILIDSGHGEKIRGMTIFWVTVNSVKYDVVHYVSCEADYSDSMNLTKCVDKFDFKERLTLSAI